MKPKPNARETTLKRIGRRAKSRRKIDSSDDESSSSGYSSNSETSKNYEEFKRTIRSVFHKVSNQKLERGDETHIRILDSMKDLFRGVDEWGNRELKVSVFKKKFRSLLKNMNECKQLTKARNFEENLVMLIEDMNTGHDDYITMAEFVAFYLYESSQLRKIVKNLSKEINKKGSDDIAYIRKWKTIFHQNEKFTKADLELLFEEVIEVALTSSELELIWDNLTHGKKKATSIKAGSVQRFFKNGLGANLHWIEQDHETPIYDIQVSANGDDNNRLEKAGYVPLGGQRLNRGKLLDLQIWYTHKKKDFLLPIVDIKLYPLKESATLFADGYTCIQRSVNTGLFGLSKLLGVQHRLMYIWVRRAPGGPQNKYAVTNLHLITGITDDYKNLIDEIPCGGYERIKGNMTGDKKKGTFLWLLRKEISPEVNNVFSSELYSGRHELSGDREKIRSNAKRVEEEKVWDSVKGIDIHQAIYHRVRMEIRMRYSSSTSDSDISNHLYKKYAISHAEKGLSKSEFRKMMKNLKVHVPTKIWDNLNTIVNYSETGYINRNDFRDFVTMRPYELDSYVQTIRQSILSRMDEEDTIESALKKVFKHYANDDNALTAEDLTLLAKDYSSSNYALTENEIQRLIVYFGSHEENRVRKKDFIRLFSKDLDSVLTKMSYRRTVDAARFLYDYMQEEYGKRIIANNGRRGKCATDMWHYFESEKLVDGIICAHEVDTVIKRASAQKHTGVSFFLSAEEIHSLMQIIQPTSSLTSKRPTINYKAFCNFFSFGNGQEQYITDIRITRGDKDSLQEEEENALSYFRGGVGIVDEDLHGDEFNLTKLWVKYGKGRRNEPFVRQLKLGPIDCSLKKRGGWKIIKPYLYKNKKKRRVFLWVSSEMESSRSGVKHLRLQPSKPPASIALGSEKKERCFYSRCPQTKKSSDKASLWILTADPSSGFHITKTKTSYNPNKIEVGESVLVFSDATQNWENATIERVRQDRGETRYDIIYSSGDTRSSNLKSKWVKKSYQMVRFNNEISNSFRLRRSKNDVNSSISDDIEEVRVYLRKEAKNKYKQTKVSSGKNGYDIRSLFRHNIDDKSEGFVSLRHFHQYLYSTGVVHGTYTNDIDLLQEIDADSDNRIDVKDLTVFLFGPDHVPIPDEYPEDVAKSDVESASSDEDDRISRSVDKLVKRLRIKIDRLGVFGLKSTINKGRTVAIRHMKSRVENILGGKSIQSNVFFALLGRTKSIDASGAVTVKKFISYFTKHNYDSSISSDEDSAVDGDSSATEDESESETDDIVYSSDTDSEQKSSVRTKYSRSKTNKIYSSSKGSVWPLYKGIVTSRSEEPLEQINTWIRRTAKFMKRRRNRANRARHLIDILRNNFGLHRKESKNIVRSIEVENSKGKKVVSMGKLRNILMRMTHKNDSRSNFHGDPFASNMLVTKIGNVLKRTNMSENAFVETFGEYDINLDNTVTKKDFRNIAGELGFNLSRAEIQDAMQSYGIGGKINYLDLLNDSKMGSKKSNIDAVGVDAIISRTKSLIKEARHVRGDTSENEIVKSFEVYDLNGTGVISPKQFKSALRKTGVTLDDEDIQTLCDHFSYAGGKLNGVDYRLFSSRINDEGPQLEMINKKIKRDLFATINNGIGYFDVMSSYDLSGDGTVTRLSFRRSLQKLNVRLTESELRGIMDKFDDGGDGRVNYGAFYRWISPFGTKASVDVEALQCRLQHLIRESAMLRPTTFDLRDAFSLFDTGKTGLVTRGQFSMVLNDMNLSMSKGDLSYLMDRFGRQNADVDYETFAKFAKCNEKEMDTIAMRLQNRFDDIMREGVDHREVFEMFDETGSGFITRNEFKEASRQLGLPLTVTQLYALMERFSHFAGMDKICYQDVLEFISNRYRKHKKMVTILPQNPRDRESIDGSNHDGFRQMTTSISAEHGQIALRPGQTSLVPPRTIEKWLDKKATDKQREAFAEVFTAIHEYDQNMSFLGNAIVDHTDNTFSRLVSHLPYDIAGTVKSTVNRNKQKQRRSRARSQSVDKYSTSSESFSSDSDDDNRVRGRRKARNKGRATRRRNDRESDGSDYERNIHYSSNRRRSRKNQTNHDRYSSGHRRGDKYESSDDNETRSHQKYSTRNRGSKRRSSRRSRYQYSSESD